MIRTGILALLALALGACSSSNQTGGGACQWPSGLTDADGRTACSPARALIECHDPSGTGCGCVSDGTISCDCGGVVGGPWTCASTCAANQYVATCGGVGPGPVPDPPPGCTFAGASPGGTVTYCCPCGG